MFIFFLLSHAISLKVTQPLGHAIFPELCNLLSHAIPLKVTQPLGHAISLSYATSDVLDMCKPCVAIENVVYKRPVWPRQQIKTCAHVQCTWNRNLEKPPFDSVETMVGERKKGSFDINSERYGHSEINDL